MPIESAPPGRIATGSAEADAILHGGFAESSINIVMGRPGSGKTIFVERLVFANAGGERPVLYLTTVSEPLEKLLRYLQQLDFYDPTLVGSQILYDDVGQEVAAEGASILPQRIGELIKSHRPRILVIDSFKAIRDLQASPIEMRRMVHRLAGLLTAYHVTTFLVGEYDAEDVSRFPEFAVADAIVELRRELGGDRDERYLRVLKLRGSSYEEGLHGFRITSGGLEIYPRLVTPPQPARYEVADERIPSGVPGLDAMLGGGLWRGSTTLVTGPAGAGKTTFGLQFLIGGVEDAEPGLLLHFQENPVQIRRLLASLGRDPTELGRAGLELMYRSPVEMRIDSVVLDALKAIEEGGLRRLVIDAVGDLSQAARGPQRLQDYLYALVQRLTSGGVTSILTLEASSGVLEGDHLLPASCSPFSDNIVRLDLAVEDEVRRRLRVLKTRSSAHRPETRELRITEAGVRVV